MIRKRKIILMLMISLVLLFAIYYLFGRGNSNALWEIISQQCVPNQQENQEPAPCLKVDLAQKYVLFKDAKGPLHDLIMPSYQMRGIESPVLDEKGAPPLFAYAWSERFQLKTTSGQPISDVYLSLAINSKYGRSQNQFHIHLACLSPDVYHSLEQEEANIGVVWAPLNVKLKGHTYLARRLEGVDLVKEDPVKLLDAYVVSLGDERGDYGLALVATKNGGLILLANRLELLHLNFGSAGEIQDYKCTIAADQTRN